MPSSLCLPLQASTGGGATTASSSCSSRLSAASSQLWRSQVWLPPLARQSRHRGLRLAFVCETAVEIDGVSSTEGVDAATPAIGSRIRVSKPLTVYHVPKHPNFDLQGCEGELKDILKSWKGKPLSANLPYKVQFLLDLDGKQVKFFAHLTKDEFEVV
ncbi:hypothetical protein GOP47_0006889 [Adiantum capillus-veneris]|uniref:Ferredoxin thioredoxin reductase alpha chain domain-containing protein n=1 Tax=Adiantum capillus-veneris TaxID=13818 RepID=A0A9D4V4R0_ADICA|nr:hypothetical protein GOP47_0006889 [Adiantum capillus-veneris]